MCFSQLRIDLSEGAMVAQNVLSAYPAFWVDFSGKSSGFIWKNAFVRIFFCPHFTGIFR